MKPEFTRDLSQRPAPEPASPQWTPGYCLTPWCRSSRWFARQDQNRPNLWLMAEQPDAAPWAVASHGPTCPLCGHKLAPHPEDIGDLADETPNPLVAFVRSLA